MNNETFIIRKKEVTSLFREGNRSEAIQKLTDLRNEYPEFRNELALISILTPSFNSANYIEETILSVVSQTYPFVEHIIQDANSSDGTRDILEKYSKYVDYVSEPDRGEADGLNRALKRAKGDIFLVLNADDVLLPDACSWAVRQFKENPGVAVIYGNQHMINPAGEILYDRIASPFDFVKELCVENVIPAQTAFIQRKYFEQAGLYVDDSLPVIPDYELWIRIGLKFPMLYIPEFICRYRVHEAQQTSQIKKIADTRLMIMDRIFNNPELVHLHIYRERAYAGNCHWAAVEYFKCKNKKAALPELLKSYSLNPELKKLHPLISVITVCDNSEKYLEKNIQSVLRQSYLYVEHIVIDNESSDRTGEILRNHDLQVESESRKTLNKPEAINRALKKCNGDIIYILDPDDEMSDNTCWWAMYHFSRFPDNIVLFGDYSLIDTDSRIIGRKFRNRPFRYLRMFCLEDEISMNTCFINRNYFENTGFSFNTAYPESSFHEFLIRAGRQYSISYHKGYVSCTRIIKSGDKDLATILTSFEERKRIILENCRYGKNPRLLKKRAMAGLNYLLSWELLANKWYKKGFRQLVMSVANPFTFAHILENIFMALVKIFKFIRHINYLILLKPTYRYRRRIGLTAEQINSWLFKKNIQRI